MSIFRAFGILFGVGRDAIYQQRIGNLSILNMALEQDVQALKETVALRDEEISDLREEAHKWEHQAGVNHRAQLSAAAERDAAREAKKVALLQVQTFASAVELLAERAKASPEELAQLGLGTLIPGDRKAGVPDEFVFGDLEDAKSAIDFAMHNQATVAKFRQLKEHFVKHQQATTIMLDQLEGIVRKNDITAEDRDRLRSMRDALSSLIGRRL